MFYSKTYICSATHQTFNISAKRKHSHRQIKSKMNFKINSQLNFNINAAGGNDAIN